MDQNIFDEFRAAIKVPIKFIHVYRNPYDNIATMTLRKGKERNKASKFGYKVDLYKKVYCNPREIFQWIFQGGGLFSKKGYFKIGKFQGMEEGCYQRSFLAVILDVLSALFLRLFDIRTELLLSYKNTAFQLVISFHKSEALSCH